MRRLQLVVASLVALLAVALAVVVLRPMAIDSGDPSPVDPTATDEPDVTGGPGPTGEPSGTGAVPTGGPGDGGTPAPTSDPGRLERFREACLDETLALTAAFVSYEAVVELTVDEPSRFTVRISGAETPSSSASPDVANQPVAVSCTVQARLVASGTDLAVSPTDWVEQSYVPPEPSSWTWVVTASDAGESAAVLQLKPTVRIARASGGIEVADLRTEEFDVSFTADRTPGAIFSSIWAALLAGAAGVTTFVAAYFAIRRFRRRDAPTENDPEKDASEDEAEDEA